MKNTKRFWKIGLTALLAAFALALPSKERAYRTAELALCVWSGLPVEPALAAADEWRIEAEHGRLLVSGTGKIAFHLPALKPGTHLDAFIVCRTNREERRIAVRILAPEALAGLPRVQLDAGSEFNTRLRALGLIEGRQGLLISDRPEQKYINAPQVVVLTRKNTCVPFPWHGGPGAIRISGCANKDALKNWLNDNASMPPDVRVDMVEPDGQTSRIIFGAGFDLSNANDVETLRKIIEETETLKR